MEAEKQHKMETNGSIINIQRFSVHDGPGIRTTVFFKGCPLDCLWCHNPESKKFKQEISYAPEKCIGCGYCRKVCPKHCHIIEDGLHSFDRRECIGCGLCTEVCAPRALELIGKEVSVKEVMDEVLKDKNYYKASGGGLTLSGGEPLAQLDFAGAILREAKRNKLHTCVETCGYVPFDSLMSVLEHVDLFLYDIKETDAEKHRQYTGKDNGLILENLVKLDKAGGKIVLRCPVIPGFNDREEHFEKICGIAGELANVEEINVMPFHPFGSYKSIRIGGNYELSGLKAPDDATVAGWISRIAVCADVPVRKG